MKVIWTQEAELDREDVLDLIALDNAAAAIRMDELFSNVVARADTCRLRKAVKVTPDSKPTRYSKRGGVGSRKAIGPTLDKAYGTSRS